MASHSQGPWTVEGPDDFGDFNIHEPGIRAVVAVVISNLRDPDEIAANARLVAAAPEMLAELQRLSKQYGHQATADVIRGATQSIGYRENSP